MSAGFIIQQLINGVTLGGMYALIALGYTLVYGIMLMINFAHSEMFMIGGFVGLGMLKTLTNPSIVGQSAVDFFTGSTAGLLVMFAITFLVAMVTVGTLGVVIERLAYRPLRHAPRLAPLISAIGVSIFLANAILLWVSTKQLPYPSVVKVRPAFTIAGASMSTLQVTIVFTSIGLMLLLDTFIARTRIGKAMRATSQDRDASGLMGIDINRMIALAFFIGPALGAVAGIFYGLYYGSVVFNMGFIPGIKSFTAAVIGGIGNLRGAMLGGFVLGILESLAGGFLSSGYQDVIAFAILILVLIFRPGGLLGESVVEKV